MNQTTLVIQYVCRSVWKKMSSYKKKVMKSLCGIRIRTRFPIIPADSVEFLQWCCVLANTGWCNGGVKHCVGTQKHGWKQNLESRMRRERKRPSLASPHNAANFLFPHRKWAGTEIPPENSSCECSHQRRSIQRLTAVSLHRRMYTYTQTHSSWENTHRWCAYTHTRRCANTHTHARARPATLHANKTRQLWWIYEAAFALWDRADAAYPAEKWHNFQHIFYSRTSLTTYTRFTLEKWNLLDDSFAN